MPASGETSVSPTLFASGGEAFGAAALNSVFPVDGILSAGMQLIQEEGGEGTTGGEEDVAGETSGKEELEGPDG